MSSSIEKLQVFPWYLGFVTRKYLQTHLTLQGDWCVRGSTTKGFIEMMICVNDGTHLIDHCLKERNSNVSGGWYLQSVLKNEDCIIFSTIGDLIRYLTDGGDENLRLKRAVHRPETLIEPGCLEVDNTRILGQGQYGIILQGVFIKKDKKYDVAVKIPRQVDTKSVSGHKAEKIHRESQLQIDQLMREADLMKRLKHTNVLRCFGIDCNNPQVKLVLLMCSGGSLLNHLRMNQGNISYEEKLIFLLEAARGIKHIHSKELIHRDIAARNCLIGRYGQLVISDFGLSLLIDEKWEEDPKELHVPIPWLAPECLGQNVRFSKKSDVFSFSIMMYEILNDGEQPWPELGDLDQIIRYVRYGKRMTISSQIPKEVADLIADCWAHLPCSRPAFCEIVKRLRKMADTVVLPRTHKRSVAKLPNVTARKFLLNDETDFDVDELSPPPTSNEIAKITARIQAYREKLELEAKKPELSKQQPTMSSATKKSHIPRGNEFSEPSSATKKSQTPKRNEPSDPNLTDPKGVNTDKNKSSTTISQKVARRQRPNDSLHVRRNSSLHPSSSKKISPKMKSPRSARDRSKHDISLTFTQRMAKIPDKSLKLLEKVKGKSSAAGSVRSVKKPSQKQKRK